MPLLPLPCKCFFGLFRLRCARAQGCRSRTTPRYQSLSQLSLYQRSERCQVFHVLVQIGRLGRLQTAGRVAKTSIVDDVTESLAADSSLADPGVTIHARAEVGLGILEMKSEDALHAHQ